MTLEEELRDACLDECVVDRVSPWCIYRVDAAGERRNVTPKVSEKVLDVSYSAFDDERHAEVTLAVYLSGIRSETMKFLPDVEKIDDAIMTMIDVLADHSYTLAGCRYFVQRCPTEKIPNALGEDMVRIHRSDSD